MTNHHIEQFQSRFITVEQAARKVRPGNRVFIGTACATPRALVKAFEDLPMPVPDVEFIHFLTTGAIPHDDTGRAMTRYRHRSFFIGSDVRAALRRGWPNTFPFPSPGCPSCLPTGASRWMLR